ncbi:MAG: hypothetical protein Q7K28_03440 [Candidatus Wildermuthbacteria bacterium]|nr:hypothetical protein [Candidatus Wildermuthbacteria bacterium]
MKRNIVLAVLVILVVVAISVAVDARVSVAASEKATVYYQALGKAALAVDNKDDVTRQSFREAIESSPRASEFFAEKGILSLRVKIGDDSVVYQELGPFRGLTFSVPSSGPLPIPCVEVGEQSIKYKFPSCTTEVVN